MEEQIIKVLTQDNKSKETEIESLKLKLQKSLDSLKAAREESYKLRSTIGQLKSQVDILLEETDGKELYADFPDISVHVNRWKTRRFSSAKVNSVATHADIGHNCGCCPDSPLELWPYIEHKGRKIFSDPCGIYIGEKYGWGDMPSEGWEEKLKNLNISDAVIEIVRQYFAENPPVLPEDDEEENDD